MCYRFACLPTGGFQRSRDNWLRPFRNQLEIARIDNLAGSHMQEDLRFRTATRLWIGFFAVVVDEKFGQPRHEPDQVEEAAIVPFANGPSTHNEFRLAARLLSGDSGRAQAPLLINTRGSRKS